MMDSVKNMPLKRKIFYIAIIIVALAVMGFGGDYALNWRKERNDLKADKKEFQKKYDALEELVNNSNEFQETEQEQQYNFYYDYQKEKKLREKYEQENFVFRNYSRFSIDSFLSKYEYRPQLQTED